MSLPLQDARKDEEREAAIASYRDAKPREDPVGVASHVNILPADLLHNLSQSEPTRKTAQSNAHTFNPASISKQLRMAANNADTMGNLAQQRIRYPDPHCTSGSRSAVLVRANHSICVKSYDQDFYRSEWFRLLQAFQIIGVLGLFAGVIMFKGE